MYNLPFVIFYLSNLASTFVFFCSVVIQKPHIPTTASRPTLVRKRCCCQFTCYIFEHLVDVKPGTTHDKI